MVRWVVFDSKNIQVIYTMSIGQNGHSVWCCVILRVFLLYFNLFGYLPSTTRIELSAISSPPCMHCCHFEFKMADFNRDGNAYKWDFS